MPYKVVGNCVHKADTGEKVDCADSPEAAGAMMRAMYASENKMKFTPEEQVLYQEFLQAKAYIDTHEIKGVIETSDGDVIIPVSAIRFGDPNNKDLHNEYFDSKTNFGNPAANEVVPVYLDHGYDKVFITRELINLGFTAEDSLKIAEEISVGKTQQGVAIRDSVDAQNLYYNVVVNRRNRYKNLLKRLAEEKLIAPSTGVKFRSAKSADGHISDWHFEELTLTPTGAEPNIGVVNKMADETPTTTVAATPPPEEPKKEEPVVTPPVENPLVAKFNEMFPPTKPEDNNKSLTTGDVLTKVLEQLTLLTDQNKALVEQNKSLETKIAEVNKMVNQTHEVMPLLINKMAEAMVPAVGEHMKLSEREKSLGVTATPSPKPNGKSLPTNAPGATR